MIFGNGATTVMGWVGVNVLAAWHPLFAVFDRQTGLALKSRHGVQLNANVARRLRK